MRSIICEATTFTSRIVNEKDSAMSNAKRLLQMQLLPVRMLSAAVVAVTAATAATAAAVAVAVAICRCHREVITAGVKLKVVLSTAMTVFRMYLPVHTENKTDEITCTASLSANRM